MEFGRKNNQIPELRNLNSYHLENYLNVYDNEGYYFYNLADSINIENINNPEYFYLYKVISNKSWTLISYENYNTIHLWWLICLINGIDNPVNFPENGTILKILKNEYVGEVLSRIKSKKS
jgi:hypothetical protein